jgi:transposase InsO family protein
MSRSSSHNVFPVSKPRLLPRRAGLMHVKDVPSNAVPWCGSVHIDHAGPFNRTSSPGNYQYVLTVVCANCHSPRFLPARTTRAIETAALLLVVFGHESFPTRIVSDRHQSFRSDLFAQLCRLTGVELSITVAGRAQGNSIAERPHRFLKSSLRALANATQTNWDEHLPQLSLAYRSGIHPSLGETPFFLERGRDPKPLGDVPADDSTLPLIFGRFVRP